MSVVSTWMQCPKKSPGNLPGDVKSYFIFNKERVVLDPDPYWDGFPWWGRWFPDDTHRQRIERPQLKNSGKGVAAIDARLTTSCV